MTTYLVTRHEGTRAWVDAMAKHGRLPFVVDRKIEHLDLTALREGDVVVGTLPIHMAAELHAMGIEFWSLDLDVPPAERGKELRGLQVAKFGGRFTRYEVRREKTGAVEAKVVQTPAAQKPGITLILVSGELAPGAIGWRHSPTPEVCLLASKKMKPQAKILQRWLEAQPHPPTVSTKVLKDESFATLLAQAEKLAGELAAECREKVVVNLTGGTKLMSMALQRAFSQRSEGFSGRLAGPYVDTAQQQIENLLSQDAATVPMQTALNVEDALALRGFEIASVTSSTPGYEAWLERTELFGWLMHKDSKHWIGTWYSLLLAMEKAFKGKPNEAKLPGSVRMEMDAGDLAPGFSFKMERDSEGSFRWHDLRKALRGAFGKALGESGAAKFSVENNSLTIALRRQPLDELAFLSGTWMEVWLAAQLRKAKVLDLAQGVEVRHGDVKNELDLVIASGNQLLLVEVKTGQMEGVHARATDVVYKFDSISQKIGRLFSERWLVSLRKMSEEDARRAKDYGIKVFAGENLKDLPEAIAGWVEANHLAPLGDFAPSRFAALAAPSTNARPLAAGTLGSALSAALASPPKGKRK